MANKVILSLTDSELSKLEKKIAVQYGRLGHVPVDVFILSMVQAYLDKPSVSERSRILSRVK